MKVRLAHFFYQADPAFPSEKPYHFEIIETPESVEEWEATRGERRRTITAQEAEALGIDMPAAFRSLNADTLKANDALRETIREKERQLGEKESELVEARAARPIAPQAFAGGLEKVSAKRGFWPFRRKESTSA